MRLERQEPLSATTRIVSYGVSGALLALTMALILEGALALSLAIAWLIGINVFALVYYGIDKLNSIAAERSPALKKENVRIPEPSLLFLALIGGSPAALLAMLLLTHKTKKWEFIAWFVLVLIAQAALVYSLRDRIF